MAGRGAEVRELSEGWEVRCKPTRARPGPARPTGLDSGAIPGTAGSALRAAGLWAPGDVRDLDDEDWWFRLRFATERARDDERLTLALTGSRRRRGYLNGDRLADSCDVVAHRLDVTGKVGERNELAMVLALKRC